MANLTVLLPFSFFFLILLHQISSPGGGVADAAAPHHHHHNRHHRHQHPSIITKTCNQIAARSPNVNYTFCVESLSAAAEGKRADLRELALLSLRLGKADAKHARARAKALLREEKLRAGAADKYKRSCLETCRELYSGAATSLRDAMKMVKSGHYGDANFYISSAVDAPGQCDDGFAEGGLKSPLRKENYGLFQHAVIGLAITARLRSPAFKVINDGGTKRNVQTWESSIDYFTILFDGELVEEKMKKTDNPRYLELSKDKGKSIIHQHSPETPSSPRKAEDFLSLVLCSSSSDIIQMLSTNGLLSQFDQYDQNEMHDEVEEDEVKSIAKSERSSNLRKEQTWLHKWYKNVKWNQKQGGILSKTNTMNRNKELANQRSKAKAALLVTRLAAVITSIAATGNFETSKPSCMIRGNGIDNKMSKAVASAAALVVNVCAEVAESFGAASKAHIASAVTSGLATQSSVDIAALTARAATVLGGESTSYLTAGNTRYVPEKKMLARGVLLPVQTPSGKIEQRIASIFHKHDRLVLKLGKMHLRGVFTTYKEYGILAIVDEEIHGHDKDAHDSKKITLHTTGGVVKMNFNDRKQCRVWKSTISHLLCEGSVSNICIDT